MKYHLKWLFQQIAGGAPLHFIFFERYQGGKSKRLTKACLSQGWPSPFREEEVDYPTAEHWMMAEKARLFKDEKRLAGILAADSPEEATRLGRQVEGFEDQIWMDHRYEIVRKGNLLKFSQNPKLQTFLLETGDSILAETDSEDRIWGIGLEPGERGMEAPKKWNGLNLLGFALMEVRDELE